MKENIQNNKIKKEKIPQLKVEMENALKALEDANKFKMLHTIYQIMGLQLQTVEKFKEKYQTYQNENKADLKGKE